MAKPMKTLSPMLYKSESRYKYGEYLKEENKNRAE